MANFISTICDQLSNPGHSWVSLIPFLGLFVPVSLVRRLATVLEEDTRRDFRRKAVLTLLATVVIVPSAAIYLYATVSHPVSPLWYFAVLQAVTVALARGMGEMWLGFGIAAIHRHRSATKFIEV